MFWPYQGPQPACTSEREICLPANYSKFQLPNKGNVTIVSIGRLPSLCNECTGPVKESYVLPILFGLVSQSSCLLS